MISSGLERSTPPSPARPRALLAAGALVLAVLGAKASARWLDAASPSAEQPSVAPAPAARAKEDPAVVEASALAIARDVDTLWARDFKRRGKPYSAAQPTLLEAPAKRDCGPGIGLGRDACYGTDLAFIDMSFQRDLGARLGPDAAGARAYVIAHEIGHHVQRVLGMDRKLDELLAERKVASHWVEVQLELQADCLAGVWSRRTQQPPWTEPTQIEASIRHASDLGTERRLESAGHDDAPTETFTYAIPRRRIYWFAQGYAKAEIDACDTFAP
jgi:predicted metalloprotease